MNVPVGRLRAKKRPFTEIVYDMRHIVCSVIRQRPMQGGQGAAPLGTGFFVARDVFITCHHVINDARDPHRPGDSYQLVANLTGTSGRVYSIQNQQLGADLHFFPNMDLAIIRVANTPQDHPFAALEYGDILEGEDIGVVGYPLPTLNVVDGNLRYDGLIFRAGRGHVTGRYSANLPDPPMTNAPVIEVDFLFVPGNSGGPVFAAETGRILGYVKGYRSVKIRESVVTATMIPELPLGMSGDYIENLNAIYSLALKLDLIRTTIEPFGVSL